MTLENKGIVMIQDKVRKKEMEKTKTLRKNIQKRKLSLMIIFLYSERREKGKED